MRVTRAALVWVFGVAATFLGVGPFGGTTSGLDNDQVLTAAPASANAPVHPVRELKAPVPSIGGPPDGIELAVPDLAPALMPAATPADPSVRTARAPPATVHS